ncbi:hypothetical protein M446_0840 [Methylobacterium sp. 4-46]|uniref:hypothetical protein n=1 Tax=unclassified Methylobacterium TaxID=2615210 RepID=UPI000165C93A|nr:hypothetical protein [Methylobacterium sp. 4-46]ACA15394.1 hypothetical protein M446_0840 [Methylobacterium sp. 4-46]
MPVSNAIPPSLDQAAAPGPSSFAASRRGGQIRAISYGGAPAEAGRDSSRLPCGWVLDGGLRLFRGDGARVGRSAAALKLLLALAVTAEEDGSALLSCAQLAALAGLTQSLIVSGKRLLADYGLVRVEAEGRRTRLALTRYGPDHRAARIRHDPAYRANPAAEIRGLRALSCRRSGHLDALKLYILLCALAGEEGAREGAQGGPVALPAGLAADLLNLTILRLSAALALLRDQGLAELGDARPDTLLARPLPLP